MGMEKVVIMGKKYTDDKIKVSFLFGAGAEGERNFNMPMGHDYKMGTIQRNGEKDDYRKSLKKYFGDKLYYDGTYKYRRDWLPRQDVSKLDAYFHTIIAPKKHSVNKFSIVFNYYWACYFCLLKHILDNDQRPQVKRYLKEDGEVNCELILNEMKQFTQLLYQENLQFSQRDTYYSLIQKYIGQNSESYEIVGVATTNYYRYCEQLRCEPIYLNGAMNLFEFPKDLEIRDLSQEDYNRDKLFFPFIFGQSFVKPIVCSRQIEEYYKFGECLQGTEVLVILGYNLNDDDNHINAYLHDFAKKGEIIVVTNDSEEQICQKLRVCEKEDNISIHCVRYESHNLDNNSKVVNEIFRIIENKR